MIAHIVLLFLSIVCGHPIVPRIPPSTTVTTGTHSKDANSAVKTIVGAQCSVRQDSARARQCEGNTVQGQYNERHRFVTDHQVCAVGHPHCSGLLDQSRRACNHCVVTATRNNMPQDACEEVLRPFHLSVTALVELLEWRCSSVYVQLSVGHSSPCARAAD